MKSLRNNTRRFNRQGKGTGSAVSLSSVGLLCMILMPWLVYQKGAGVGWIAIGCFGATLLLWQLCSYRLLRFSIQQNRITLPGYFGKRFGEKSPALRIIFAVVLAAFLLLSATMILYILTSFSKQLFGSRVYLTAIGVALISTGFYFLTGRGGLRRVERWFAALVLFSLLAMNVSIFRVLGTRGILENIFHSWAAGSVSEFVNVTYMGGESLSIVEIISLFALGFLVLGNPISLQRFQQTDRARTIHRSRRWAVIFCLLALFLATLTGGMLRASLYPARITSVQELFRWILEEDQGRGFLFHLTGVIFVVSAGLLILSQFHACILQATHIIHENIYPYLGKKNKKNRPGHEWAFAAILILSEIVVVSNSVGCGDWIYRVTGLSFLVLASGLAPVLVLSLHSERMTGTGCLAGFLGGALTAAVWTFGNWIPSGTEQLTMFELTNLTAVVPAMAMGVLMVILGSKLSKAPSEQIVREFEEVKFRLVTSDGNEKKDKNE